jgi:hypothetical protein
MTASLIAINWAIAQLIAIRSLLFTGTKKTMTIQIDYAIEHLDRLKLQQRFAEFKVIDRALDEGFSITVTRLKESNTKLLFLKMTDGEDSYEIETVYVEADEIEEVAAEKKKRDKVSFFIDTGD